MLILILLHLLGFVYWIDGKYMNGTVYYDQLNQNYTVQLDTIDCNTGIACGYFNDSLNATGWNVLEIKTNNKNNQETDYNRMYAAGYLEGYLSSKEIYYSYLTQWLGMKNDYNLFQTQLKQWTQSQREWIDAQIKNNPNDIYWHYIDGLTGQFDGQIDGYNDAVLTLWNETIPYLTEWQFQFIVGNADLADVIVAIITQKRSGNTLYKHILHRRRERLQTYEWMHCSGYVHVTPLLDNIFFSHSTWWSYYCTNRVFKHYIFELDAHYPTVQLSMSSFPGCLSSTDDYYQMDSGLVSMETTNSIYNEELFQLLTPQTLFTWQRARVANALAKSVTQWVDVFSKYNSGTYNSQWIVLNYNLFTPKQPLVDHGLLMIVEQIPGNISSRDVSQELERGYWASYNIPSIEYIYKVSGAEEYATIHGVKESYDLCPRAMIFRRDGNKANNMSDVMKLMRYNNYLKDDIESNNSMWAVMSRGDLQLKPGCFGGIDTKVSDYNMMKALKTVVKNGPTNDNTPTFEWNGVWSDNSKCPHIGLPLKYDFDWVEMESLLNTLQIGR